MSTVKYYDASTFNEMSPTVQWMVDTETMFIWVSPEPEYLEHGVTLASWYASINYRRGDNMLVGQIGKDWFMGGDKEIFPLSRRVRWNNAFRKFGDIYQDLKDNDSEDFELIARLERVLDKMEEGEWCIHFHPYNDEMISYREV